MEYIYYKDKKGNFGDDLNAWLWPQLFGEENILDNISFFGIGSILYNEAPFIKTLEGKKKIVFGTGVRASHNLFKVDNSWDIKFVRGPLSSACLNNDHKYIADAAYAIQHLKDFHKIIPVQKKIYNISLMPYFKSVRFFNWPKICQQLGMHYISPYSEQGVGHTLKEIAASKYLITEAMHGAILADILRVPWKRFILTTPFTEGEMISEFKWNDWIQSIKLSKVESTYIKFYRNSILNKIINYASFNAVDTRYFIKRIVQQEIISELSKIEEYYLSSDGVMDDINYKMGVEIENLKRAQELR